MSNTGFLIACSLRSGYQVTLGKLKTFSEHDRFNWKARPNQLTHSLHFLTWLQQPWHAPLQLESVCEELFS
jgi:hypothetical protein